MYIYIYTHQQKRNIHIYIYIYIYTCIYTGRAGLGVPGQPPAGRHRGARLPTHGRHRETRARARRLRQRLDQGVPALPVPQAAAGGRPGRGRTEPGAAGLPAPLRRRGLRRPPPAAVAAESGAQPPGAGAPRLRGRRRVPADGDAIIL